MERRLWLLLWLLWLLLYGVPDRSAFKDACDKDICTCPLPACREGGGARGTAFTTSTWASVKDMEEKLRSHRQSLETLIDRKLSELKEARV